MTTLPHGTWHQLHADEVLGLLEVDLSAVSVTRKFAAVGCPCNCSG
jgi:hypothetical protein